MKKIEQVFREILYQAIERKNSKLTQLELSKNLNLSLSTINLAIKKLEEIGAVKIEKMGFNVIAINKILYYWASFRKLNKGITYQTRVEMPVREIERLLPNVILAAYSAYKLKFNDVPADYSEVYVYADQEELDEIKKRFSKNNKIPNLFVLEKDQNIEKYSKTGTIAQIFVDLWNLKQWYAQDFINSLKKKISLED